MNVLVAGSRCPYDYDVLSAMLSTFLNAHRRDSYSILEYSNVDELEAFVVRYAHERDLALVRCTQSEVERMVTHVVVFWDRQPGEAEDILEWAHTRGLKTQLVLI